MSQAARDFMDYAHANWGLKYTGISDDELSALLELRLETGDYASELSEAELSRFKERQNLKALEDEAQFETFKSLALEKWTTFDRGLSADAIERILLVRRDSKDFSLKLSIAERAPIFLHEKARQAEFILQEKARRAEFILQEKARRAELDKALLEKLYPSKSAEVPWLSKRTRPAIQPYGVSHQGAEQLVADWLRFLGEEAVNVTQESGDGGVDVLTRDYCCQVKNYSRQNIGSPEVRDLFGTATSMGLSPLLFTSTGLTPDAEAFSLRNSIPAIRFVAETSELRHLNEAGEGFLNAGRYTD